MDRKKKLLVVDDHILFREGLAALFQKQPDYKVVGEAGTIAEAIQMAATLEPDVVLMDFSLPDGTGAEATKTILANKPETKVVFLTMHDSDDFLFEAVRSGARGYLLKNLPVSKLLDSLRGLERNEVAISRKMMGHLMDEFASSQQYPQPGDTANQLTEREREVLRELTTGATNKEIADRLSISMYTVKNHIHNMLKKMNQKNRRELVNYCLQHNIVIQPPK